MAAPPSAYQDRHFLAVIGDEDSVTGLLLAGIGHVTPPPDAQKNFLVCNNNTETSEIEAAFDRFVKHRKDIAILLINQHVRPPSHDSPSLIRFSGEYRPNTKYVVEQVAEKIRHRMDTYSEAFPAVLEIPSKDHPYDPEKDSVLRRVRRLFGE